MNVIQVKTDSGEIVYVQVSEGVTILGGPVGGGSIAGDEDVAARMMQKIEGVGSTIADVCRSIQRQVLATVGDSKPSELTLEFGIVLAGEAGIPLVTKGSVEGTFTVTAKWDFSKSEGA